MSAYLEREFDRYRLGSQRVLVSLLKLGAAIGSVAGLNHPWMGRAGITIGVRHLRYAHR